MFHMSEDLQKKGATPLVDPTPVYDARELITEGSQARIQLDDQMYTLRITRAGKLILTK